MILVTGGTGMLGAHLIYHLLKDGNKVKAIKRKSSSLEFVSNIIGYYSNTPDKLMDSIEWITCDILDQQEIEQALEGVTKVYHAAAEVSFSHKLVQKINAINIDGTANIVNACIKKQDIRLCYVSSIASLGSTENGELINEETSWSPSNHHSTYSVSKFKAELEVWRGIEEGLDAVIVNPSVILGAGNWKKGSPQFFKMVWDGLKYYTKGVTGYVDVNDVCMCMIQLMNSKISSSRFVINSENLTFQELFNKIAISLDKPSPNIYASPFLSNLAANIDGIKSKITLTTPVLTRDAVRTSHKIRNYSNEKIIDALDYKFTPIDNTINQIAEIFLPDRN